MKAKSFRINRGRLPINYAKLRASYRESRYMPRRSRIVVPGVPHHITQRGNRREQMFFSDKDREKYLELLSLYSQRNGLDVLCYCLMPNHTHLIVVPQEKQGLALTFKPLHMQYSRYLNESKNRCGVNWQGRFYSSPMDVAHTWHAIQYVLLNPVRANLVDRVIEYPWSSALLHINKTPSSILSSTHDWARLVKNATQELLGKEIFDQDAKIAQKVRKMTASNLPIGDDSFVKRLEDTHNRRLTLGKSGRPVIGKRPRL